MIKKLLNIKIDRRPARGWHFAYFAFLTLFMVSSVSLPKPSFAQTSQGTNRPVNKAVQKALNKNQVKKAPKKKRVFNNKRLKKKTNQRKKSYPRKRTKSKLVRSKTSGGGKTVIQSFRNKVAVQSAGKKEWTPARKNAEIKSSDRIKTGRRSMARIKMDDGSKILLLQNSQAEVENLSTVEKAIKLLRGRVRAVVRKLKARSFKIKTPIGVASVRGTEFEVEYVEEQEEMVVDVIKGQVGVSKLGDLAEEVILNPGDRIRFNLEGELGDPIRTGAIPLQRSDVRAEMHITQVKESVVALAAQEIRNADFQVGKSLIDVDGTRVRVEEYITRPAANKFKLVALNHRPTRFDYFTYTGTFNQDLPTDLSVALGQVGGKLGTTAPDYYLTDYEMTMSNTIDTVNDIGSGGHLVKIDFDGTTYTLTDNADSSNTKSIDAAVLQTDGSYKIYNPISDKYSLVSATNLSEALNISVKDSVGNYSNLASGDTYWKTRFNSNTFSINGVTKTSFSQKTTANTLAIDLDATFSNAPITAVSEFPSGTSNLHNRLSLFYSDGSKVVYDNYIIDDEGTVATTSAFSGISTSAAYQNELENWNYQQKMTSDEMSGRSINLVIDPRIGTLSGLIQ